MVDLVEYLRARLDEDEAVAQAAEDVHPSPWRWEDPGLNCKQALVDRDRRLIVPSQNGDIWPSVMAAAHTARWDPARMLAEVAAKREIVDIHANFNDGDCEVCARGEWGYPSHGGARPEPWPCPTLRALVQPYADHPDFDPVWRADVTHA